MRLCGKHLPHSSYCASPKRFAVASGSRRGKMVRSKGGRGMPRRGSCEISWRGCCGASVALATPTRGMGRRRHCATSSTAPSPAARPGSGGIEDEPTALLVTGVIGPGSYDEFRAALDAREAGAGGARRTGRRARRGAADRRGGAPAQSRHAGRRRIGPAPRPARSCSSPAAPNISAPAPRSACTRRPTPTDAPTRRRPR